MRFAATLKALLPAVTLAALVLFVFATLQNYGPESAVRRFHEAVLTRNVEELNEVVYVPFQRQDLDALVLSLQKLFAAGARIRLRDVERSPYMVHVSVLYHTPSGASGSGIWVARKTPAGWKVDVGSTLAWARFH